MTGIDFLDSIAVRRTRERGTTSTDKPVLPVEFMGRRLQTQMKIT